MKLFEVIEYGCYEFESTIQTAIFSTRERAVAEWKRRVENCLVEIGGEDEIVVESNEDRLFFDAYKDGRASEWECNIYVCEKELDED